MRDEIKLLIAFLVLIMLDLSLVGLFIHKAHPNFTEWYGHLK
jgi:hypothetical protein